MPKGSSKRANRKLSNEDVKYIDFLSALGVPNTVLADRYGVSHGLIKSITTRDVNKTYYADIPTLTEENISKFEQMIYNAITY
jgi:hypothetical protein